MWLCFVADARTRWRAWLGLALLVGLASGAILAIAAGARRTDSAYGRFLEHENAYDVALAIPPRAEPGLAQFDPEEIGALPQVDEYARGWLFQTGESWWLASADGRLGTEVNRFKILAGRAADPARPDEAVVGFEYARVHGTEVGDQLTLVEPTEVEPAPPGDGVDPVAEAYAAIGRLVLEALPDGKVTVVGVEASPGEFPPALGGPVGQVVHLTPAFERIVGGASDAAEVEQGVLFARLDQGADDIAAFERELTRLAEGASFELTVQRDNAANVQRSFHTQAIALWLLAGLSAVTAIVIVSQLLARAAWLESADFPTLAALGVTRTQRALLGAARAGTIGVSAAIVAVAVAVSISPLFPTGLVRKAEPDIGFEFDGLALGVGVVAVLLVVIVLGAVPAARAASVIVSWRDRARARRPSVVARTLSGLGASLAAVAGARMALEPGRGRTSVPVRSAVACLTLAIATIVAALGFGASLTHLLDTPRLYGVGWDLQFTVFEGDPTDAITAEDQVEAAAERFRSVAGVEAISVGYAGVEVQVGAVRADAVILDVLKGEPMISMIEGRHPRAPDEIVLGTQTLERLGVRIGSRIDVSSPGVPARSMRIVGRGVMPPSSDRGRLGEGSFVSLSGLDGIDGIPAPSLFLSLDESLDGDSLAADVADQVGIVDFEAGTERLAPADILNFGRIQRMPDILGAVVGVLASGALAHVLISAVRRRQRDLALMRTLGFARGQVRRAIEWQATALVVLSLALGVPLGVVVGRWVWTLFAEDIGVVVVTIVPGPAVAALVVGAVVAGYLVAVIPAWLAGRTRPATALRSE